MDNNKVITIQGKVDRVFKKDERTGFIIAACTPYEDGEVDDVYLSIYGNFTIYGTGFLMEDVAYSFTGVFKKNNKYDGFTFHFDQYEKILPNDEEGMIHYLMTLKGIGPSIAQRIVKRFGMKSVDVMELEPHRLLEISGITQNKLDIILENFKKNEDFENIIKYLKRFHVSTKKCALIYEEFGAGAEKKIAENPYILCDAIDRISFLTSDMIAAQIGYPNDGFYRLEASITHLLKMAASNKGHLFLHEDELFLGFQKLCTSVDSVRFKEVLEAMESQEKIVRVDGNDKIYLKRLFKKEVYVAYKTKKLVSSSIKIKNLEKVFEEVQKKNKITYAEKQKEAMIALNCGSSFFIITGGPGTGKSTIIKGILDIIQKDNPRTRILMAAPTGRAAKRMEETTGHKASTLHRLLEFNPIDKRFSRNNKNPLDADVIIVDESSMIDLELFGDFVDAVDNNTRLIMVGDIDQLPPVGAGYVFRDLIESGIVPVVQLNKVFRQADGSFIKVNAAAVRDGSTKLSADPNSFVFDAFKRRDDRSDIQAVLSKTLSRFTENYNKLYPIFKEKTIYQVQILSPMRKGLVGVENLNHLVQGIHNPPSDKKKQFTFSKRTESTDVVYREGDKVMQITNDYDKLVFNGDLGIIVEVHTIDNVMVVEFENGERVSYDKSEIRDNLVLAYATTVHKSQGSEYNTVLVISSYAHAMMRQRNLFYTAITRAKEKVHVIGDVQSVAISIKTIDQAKRNSRLKELLRDEK